MAAPTPHVTPLTTTSRPRPAATTGGLLDSAVAIVRLVLLLLLLPAGSFRCHTHTHKHNDLALAKTTDGLALAWRGTGPRRL